MRLNTREPNKNDWREANYIELDLGSNFRMILLMDNFHGMMNLLGDEFYLFTNFLTKLLRLTKYVGMKFTYQLNCFA